MSMPSLFRPSGITFALALALAAAGVSGPGGSGFRVAAQASAPCALVTTGDVQPLAAKATVTDGIATSFQTTGSSSCRYTWTDVTGPYKLEVTLHDASRMFPGMNPDAIKQGLQTVTQGTADTAVSGVGDAAVFKADSPLYVHATAYAKGRIVQVTLDGFDARDKKEQVVTLLSTAASKL